MQTILRVFNICLLLALCHCDPDLFIETAPPFFNSQADTSITSLPTNDEMLDPIMSLVILPSDDLELELGASRRIFLQATLKNGSVKTLKKNILWYANDKRIATINTQGRLQAMSAGRTRIIARYQNLSALLTVTVLDPKHETEVNIPEEPEPEPDVTEEPPLVDEEPEPTTLTPEIPIDPSDRFLNSNDIFYDAFASDSVFGIANFPAILYGPPVDTYDVVSLGIDGELIIELNGFLIIDGPGVDFTVFENPFGIWMECARVAVSSDNQTYYSFECDPNQADGDYGLCSGIVPVTTGLTDAEYLDPTLSGGDLFDLAELNLPSNDPIKYIKLTDVGMCTPEPDNPGLQSNGFDLDAIGLINGVND